MFTPTPYRYYTKSQVVLDIHLRKIVIRQKIIDFLGPKYEHKKSNIQNITHRLKEEILTESNGKKDLTPLCAYVHFYFFQFFVLVDTSGETLVEQDFKAILPYAF